MKVILKYRFHILSLLFIVVVILSIMRDFREERLLRSNTNEIFAVFTGVSTSRYGSGSNIRYSVDSKVIEKSVNFFEFLEIGDTILIKYSVEDPTVIELVDPCIMKKHQNTVPCISWKQKNEASKRRKMK